MDIAKRKFARDLPGFFKTNRAEILQAVLSLFHGVQRQGRSMLGALLPVVELGILFLQVSGVGQKNCAEINGGLCGVDGSAETVLHQTGDPPAMVQVRVSEDDGINFPGGNWRVLPVAFAPFFLSLKESAIQQYLQTALARSIGQGVDQMLGTGNDTGRTKKLNVGQRGLLKEI